MKKTTVIELFCLISILNFLTGCGQNNFTGTFLADSRPHEILYLALIQSKDTVSGSLIIVKPDSNGSIDSDTLPIRGTADRDAITLTADRLFGNLIINGKKEGRNIMLMFPTNSGSISNLTLEPTTVNNYNVLLKQWQKELVAIHIEKETLTELARDLSHNINAAKHSEINDILSDIKSALDDERSALHVLESDLAELKQDASLRPMTCYQANSKVDYDYNSKMEYSYSSRLGYAHDKFMSRLEELEKRISNVEPLVSKIREGTLSLGQAIEGSKYPLPELNFIPSDEKQVLEQYQAVAVSARNELPVLKVAHSDIQNKAKEIMQKGESIVKQTQASVRCD